MIPTLFDQLAAVHSTKPRAPTQAKPKAPPKNPKHEEAKARVAAGVRRMKRDRQYTTDELGCLIGVYRRSAQGTAIRKLEAHGKVRKAGERKMPSGNMMHLWVKV